MRRRGLPPDDPTVAGVGECVACLDELRPLSACGRPRPCRPSAEELSHGQVPPAPGVLSCARLKSAPQSPTPTRCRIRHEGVVMLPQPERFLHAGEFNRLCPAYRSGVRRLQDAMTDPILLSEVASRARTTPIGAGSCRRRWRLFFSLSAEPQPARIERRAPAACPAPRLSRAARPTPPIAGRACPANCRRGR
jgi:hypothetical protein